MPEVGNLEKYRNFMECQDTTSMYKETVSTTQKRQNAVALRRSINAKLASPPQKPKKTTNVAPKNVFKSINIGFLPNTIADWEEKERKMMMASRTFLVIIAMWMKIFKLRNFNQKNYSFRSKVVE